MRAYQEQPMRKPMVKHVLLWVTAISLCAAGIGLCGRLIEQLDAKRLTPSTGETPGYRPPAIS